MAAGTYRIRYALQKGRSGLDCPSIADGTTTVAASESFSTIVTATMIGADDAGVSCTSSESGCDATVTCANTSSGATQLSETFQFGDNLVHASSVAMRASRPSSCRAFQGLRRHRPPTMLLE
jgi:hypothetical protein